MNYLTHIDPITFVQPHTRVRFYDKRFNIVSNGLRVYMIVELRLFFQNM